MNNYRTPATGLIRLTPAAQHVLDAITAVGGRPLIVGGAVRDALLERQNGIYIGSKDIDIEVYGLNDNGALIAALSRIGGVMEYNAHFSIIIAHVDWQDFDITFPRRDSKVGTGHRGFDVGIDPELGEAVALGRRDFTLNAIGYDPTTQEVVDPWGGQQDLNDGILRHINASFSDDPLRVLRAFQFVARFDLAIAPETAKLARSIAHRFDELSVERVWGEWRKFAHRGVHISRALDALVQTGWIQHFPELDAMRGVPQDPTWHPEGDVFTHLGLAADAAAVAADRDGWEDLDREIAVFGALVHDFGKVSNTQLDIETGRITAHGHAAAGVAPAKNFLDGIGAPFYLVDTILPIVREHMCHAASDAAPSPAVVRRLIRRLAPASILEWSWVVDADCTGRGTGAKPSPAAAWLAVGTDVGITPRKGILTGAHLIARGMAPGPAFRPVLEAALVAQDDGAFDDEAGALLWLSHRVAAG